MARQPIQILVIPFRKHGTEFEYCLLKRSDDHNWQFVAGGVESDETAIQAARREANEEAGIPLDSDILPLDSICSIPAKIFRDYSNWPEGTYVVKERAFGVSASDSCIKLSSEHTEFRWLSYADAVNLLKWDSNKTALWELSERLQRL